MKVTNLSEVLVVVVMRLVLQLGVCQAGGAGRHAGDEAAALRRVDEAGTWVRDLHELLR